MRKEEGEKEKLRASFLSFQVPNPVYPHPSNACGFGT
jgi:hypothetical protein